MTNEDIIKKVIEWQVSPYTHELTCGSETCKHVPLHPVEKEGKVVLKCLVCDYEQTFIPEHILETDIDKIEQTFNDLLKKRVDKKRKM